MDSGKTTLFLKYFGFLVNEFNMRFAFQKFADYRGFQGPIYTYSFYNENGCITFHNIAQRGEWGWYISKVFIKGDQYILLENEIYQSEYLNKNYFLTRSWVKDLSNIIYKNAKEKKQIFSIRIKEK